MRSQIGARARHTTYLKGKTMSIGMTEVETGSTMRGWDADANTSVFRLDAASLEATREKLAKINAHAAKRGFTGRWDLNAKPASWVEHLEGGRSVTRHGFDVTLTGTAPRMGDWVFLGAADAVQGTDAVVIRCAPGAAQEVQNEDIEPGRCDHCRTVRNRKRTLLVRHAETGEVVQVGSTCVKDFLGWDASPVLIWNDAVERELRSGFTIASAGWSVEEVLAYAIAAVEELGWKPSGFAAATKDAVADALSAGGPNGKRVRDALAPRMPAARAGVPALLTAIHDAYGKALTGYEANLAAACQSGAVIDWRQLGLAVSAVPAWYRLIEKEVERAEVAATPDAWLGTVGEKLTVTGSVTRASRFPSDYYGGGDTILVVLLTPGGVVKTYSSADWAHYVKQGDEVTITGTVKKHDTYNDKKQTVLTRTKRVI